MVARGEQSARVVEVAQPVHLEMVKSVVMVVVPVLDLLEVVVVVPTAALPLKALTEAMAQVLEVTAVSPPAAQQEAQAALAMV